MKYKNLLKIINEHATGGATCSANIATCISGSGNVLSRSNRSSESLGVGFNPNGDWGIYEPKKKKTNKENKK